MMFRLIHEFAPNHRQLTSFVVRPSAENAVHSISEKGLAASRRQAGGYLETHDGLGADAPCWASVACGASAPGWSRDVPRWL